MDERLEMIRSIGVRRFEDLGAVAGVNEIVSRLLEPPAAAGQSSTEVSPPGAEDWQRSRLAKRCVRLVLGHRLAAMEHPARQLVSVLGTSSHLTLLELAAVEPAMPGTSRAVEFLLETLPADQIGGLVRVEDVPRSLKLTVLACHVIAHGELPPGCEDLWDLSSPRSQSRPLLADLLARLDNKVLGAFCRRVAPERREAMVIALREACRQKEMKRAVLAAVVKTLDETALLSIFHSQGARFFADYPAGESELGLKLRQTLGQLPERVERFQERLDLVIAGSRLLPAEEDRQRAMAWMNCREAVFDIDPWQSARDGPGDQTRGAKLASAVRRMAEAAAAAMPPDLGEDELPAKRKCDFLHRLGSELLDGARFLPEGVREHDELWGQVRLCLQTGYWPEGTAKKLARRFKLFCRPPSQRDLFPIAVAAAVLLLLLSAGMIYWSVNRSHRPAVSVARETVRAAARKVVRRLPRQPRLARTIQLRWSPGFRRLRPRLQRRGSSPHHNRRRSTDNPPCSPTRTPRSLGRARIPLARSSAARDGRIPWKKRARLAGWTRQRPPQRKVRRHGRRARRH